ncbi:hypothetical protein ACJX0J_028690, partial [Zea mays]
ERWSPSKVKAGRGSGLLVLVGAPPPVRPCHRSSCSRPGDCISTEFHILLHLGCSRGVVMPFARHMRSPRCCECSLLRSTAASLPWKQSSIYCATALASFLI